ncbi:MAG: shufflon system plasmid conjugative transfer pilus tip adhesin PilV [Arsenophonus sp. NC-QC1-MAG3]
MKYKPELNKIHTAIDMSSINLNNASIINAKNWHYLEETNAGSEYQKSRRRVS